MPPRPARLSRARGIILRLALCLILGLTCTAATTVTAVRLGARFGRGNVAIFQLVAPAEQPGRVLCVTVRRIRFLAGREYYLYPLEEAGDGAQWSTAPPIRLPAWVQRPEAMDQWSMAEGYGFPFTCAAWSIRLSHSSDPWLSWIAPHTRPIWSGILLTTLMWAGVWLGLLVAVPAVRRALRCRRGLCPNCAYELVGSIPAGCPECGWDRAEA